MAPKHLIRWHPSAATLWRFALAAGLLGLTTFFIFGGLIILGMANYAGRGPQDTPRGFQAVWIVILGGLIYGPQLALRCWYLSAPLVALTLYASFRLYRLGREPHRPFHR